MMRVCAFNIWYDYINRVVVFVIVIVTSQHRIYTKSRYASALIIIILLVRKQNKILNVASGIVILLRLRLVLHQTILYTQITNYVLYAS